MNLLVGTSSRAECRSVPHYARFRASYAALSTKGPITVGLRPEAFELSSDNEGIPATVRVVEELGAEAFVYAQLAEHASSSFTICSRSRGPR